MAAVIPGGNAKGTALEQADSRDIQFWMGKKREKLAQDPNHQFAANDRRWVAEAEAVLAKRSSGGTAPSAPAQRQQAPSSALAPVAASSDMAVVGSFADPKSVTTALRAALEHYHLVTPAMVVGTIPEGCEVVTSIVTINPNPDAGEVYSVGGGKLGIDRVALARIGAAAGVSWDSSRRVDDRSDPHYCAWEAVLVYKQFDGQMCRVPGNVDIDAREGGAAYTEIVEKAAKGNRSPDAQLLELRKFLVRHCESKAMNKAIANMGVRRSYKPADLQKPFLVARLAFTGRTNDPELRKMFASMIAQSHLSGSAALYGQLPAPSMALPSSNAPQYVSPPPLGAPQTYDDYESGFVDDEPASEPSTPQTSAQPPAQTTPDAAAATGKL